MHGYTARTLPLDQFTYGLLPNLGRELPGAPRRFTAGPAFLIGRLATLRATITPMRNVCSRRTWATHAVSTSPAALERL